MRNLIRILFSRIRGRHRSGAVPAAKPFAEVGANQPLETLHYLDASLEDPCAELVRRALSGSASQPDERLLRDLSERKGRENRCSSSSPIGGR